MNENIVLNIDKGDKMKAKCMQCGEIHPKHEFKKNQICYLLWCEKCGTSMHEPVKNVSIFHKFLLFLNCE